MRRRWNILPLLVLAMACSSGDSGGVLIVEGPLCFPEGLPDPAGPPPSQPVIIPESRVQPQYPEQARIMRIEGTVLLTAFLATNGIVCMIDLIEVDPTGWGFEDASIEAISQWLYEPAMQDGVPVTTSFAVRIDFELNLAATESAEESVFVLESPTPRAHFRTP